MLFEGETYFILCKTNNLINELRAKSLGQSILFDDILPRHLSLLSVQEKANHLARQFIYALGLTTLCPEEKLERVGHWIYDIILFLLENVNEDEHNFYSVLKICRLEQPTRRNLLEDKRYKDSLVRTDETFPVDIAKVEEAILLLASNTVRYKEIRRIYYQLLEIKMKSSCN